MMQTLSCRKTRVNNNNDNNNMKKKILLLLDHQEEWNPEYYVLYWARAHTVRPATTTNETEKISIVCKLFQRAHMQTYCLRHCKTWVAFLLDFCASISFWCAHKCVCGSQSPYIHFLCVLLKQLQPFRRRRGKNRRLSKCVTRCIATVSKWKIPFFALFVPVTECNMQKM